MMNSVIHIKGPKTDFSRGSNLYVILKARAEKWSGRIALTRPDPGSLTGVEELTYGQLLESAGRMAAVLSERGLVLPGGRVLVLYRPEPLYPAAELAVIACGGVIVPVDISQPPQWRRELARAAGVSLVIGERDDLAELDPGLPSIGVTALFRSRPGRPLAEPLVGGRDPYCLFFTSGSTGRPKGVLMPHDGLLRLVLNNGFLKPEPGHFFLQHSSPAFDAFTLETWLPLFNGASVIMTERGRLSTPASFSEGLGPVSHLWLTAGLFNFFSLEKPDMFRHLKVLMAGGDVLNPSAAAAVLQACPQLQLLNGYGPTENSTFTTTHAIRPGENPVPLGRPVANTDLHLLPAPDHGQDFYLLWCSGPGLALGYLGDEGRLRPDEAFADLETGPGQRVRAYNTGDLVRLNGSDLIFEGRADRQVKIRGYRVEPAEVEKFLLGLPGVLEVAVITVKDGQGNKSLRSFLAAPDLMGEGGELLVRRRLEELPAHLRPGGLVVLERLPLNANGKVDRAALAEMAVPEPEKARVIPEAGRSRAGRLAAVMAEVLELPAVDPADNFFRLGGDSLKAIRVMARIEKREGLRLSLADFFADPSAAGLAGRAKAVSTGEAEADPGRTNGARPLTFWQRPFFVHQKLYPPSPAYNVPVTLRLDGRLSVASLEKALDDLWARHDILRARVEERNGEICLICPESDSPDWAIEDLGGLARPADQALALAEREALRPFALAPGEPLARIRCWKTGEQNHLLFFNFFHGLIDHWGLTLLLKDLGDLYGHYCRGLNRPPAPASFFAAAEAAEKNITAEEQASQLNWWHEYLTGAPEPLSPPPDYYPYPAEPDFVGAEYRFSLPPETLAALRDLARDEGVPLFPLLTALFGALTARRTGPAEKREIVVGVPISLRRTAAEQAAAGLFLNTLPLRLMVDPAESWRRYFQRTAAGCRELMAQAQAAPDKILEGRRAENRAVAANGRPGPLFRILAAHTPELNDNPGLWPDLAVEARVMVPGSKFDLSLIFSESRDRLTCSFEYRTSLYGARRIRHLAGSFQKIAQAAALKPDEPLGRADQLTDEEAAFLIEVNDTAAPCPWESPPADLMRAGDLAAPAVYDDHGVLNYGEFFHRVDHLAALLSGQGLKAGSFAALLLERSALNLAAAQAVLRVGAAFIPLDPSLPEARLGHMVEDAGENLNLLLAGPAQLELAERLAGKKLKVLTPDDADHRSPQPISEFRLEADYDEAAYALFTSGSTGRPKGAVNTRAGLINRLWWMQRNFPLTPKDVVLHKTPLSFDVSVWELFWWSLAGASTAVLSSGQEKNPEAICSAVLRHAVTTIHFVPSMLSELLFWAERTGRLGDLAPLRRIFVSGEGLGRDLAERCLRLLPQAELHNLYGPTEAAIDVTWEPCRLRDIALETGPVPIGRPVDNTRIHITEEYEGRRRLLPPGVPGEITLAGIQVGRGYLNRPDLTAAVFGPDIFKDDGPAPGRRIYHTGDRGLVLPDGRILCLGRIAGDGQIKIRGQRIELEEVEAVLAGHPKVDRAVVVPRRDKGTMVGLTAWIKAETAPEPNELKLFLADRLTGAMRPDRWFRLEQVPVNASGKLDRRALENQTCGPELFGGSDGLNPQNAVKTRPVIHAVSGLEEEVAAVWEQVLGRPPAGSEQGFFEAGGNSLSVIRLHALLEERWPGHFTPPDLFRFATVRQQAGRLTAEDPLSKIPALEAGQIYAPAPEPAAVTSAALRLADYRDWPSFAQDIYEGRSRVIDLPPARKNESEEMRRALGWPLPGQWRKMAYLDDIFAFAPGRFRLNFLDAVFMDPAHRLFLETALDCLEQNGRNSAENRGARMGVFLTGAPDLFYRQVLEKVYPDREASIFAQGLSSALAGRLSYLFDWHGPALMVDTACSSGLAAIHLACRALADGECDEALVGGARVVADPAPRQLPFISPRQITRAYDRQADGAGEGEGAFAFLLKPLSRALAQGDRILALIASTAVNHDGASSSLTAPNPEAQAALIRQALDRAQIEPEQLGYLEGHGTGTRLGDPVELNGLKLALGAKRSIKAGLGSGKGNFGHLDHAAGFLGLARAMVALDFGFIPPQPWFTALPDEVDSASLPCFVSPTPARWPFPSSAGPRVAGVSAFGLSGINCHVILQQAPDHEPARRQTSQLLLPAETRRCRPVWRPSTQTPSGPASPLRPVALPEGPVVMALPLGDSGFWPASEHLVYGRPTLVGMAAISLFSRLTALPARLNRLSWPRMLHPEELEAESAQARLADNRLTVTGRLKGGDWVDFVQASLAPAPSSRPDLDEKEAARLLREGQKRSPAGSVDLSGDENSAVRVSARWHCLKALWSEGEGPLARRFALLELPPSGADEDFPFHPGVLDNAVSLGLKAAGELLGGAAAPFSCEALEIYGHLPSPCLSVFRPDRLEQGFLSGEVLVTDLDGRAVLNFQGLIFRPAESPARVIWQIPKERPPEPVSVGAPAGRLVFPGYLAEVETEDIQRAVRDPAVGGVVIRARGEENDFYALADIIKAVEAAPPAPSRQTLEIFIALETLAEEEAGHVLVRGLAEAISTESPRFTCRCLDIPPAAPDEEILTTGQARKWELTTVPSPLPGLEKSFIHPGAHYLITGGFGGLGLALADYILKKGGRLTLLHRNPPGPDNEEGRLRLALLEEIKSRAESKNCLLTIKADVADEEDVRAALELGRRKFGKLSGVIHAAGVGGGGLLWRRDRRTLAEVLKPKVRGSWLLNKLTAADPLDFFILFSSRDSLIPSPGQADYVAANLWLNEFAVKLRRQGRPAVAILWPTLGGLGMASRHGLDGQALFRPDDLPDILAEALRLDQPVAAPLPALKTAGKPKPEAGLSSITLTGRRDGAYTASEKYLAEVWGRYLGETAVDVRASFSALGGDSLTAISVVNHIDPAGNKGLSLMDILGDNTLAELAAKLNPAGQEAAQEPGAAAGSPGLRWTRWETEGRLPPPGEDGSVLIPMTPAQNIIWQADLEYKADTAYNLPFFMELDPAVEPERLQKALNELMAFHQCLRLEVLGPVKGGDTAMMKLWGPDAPLCRFPLQIADWPGKTPETEVLSFLGSQVKPFSLARFPLCRALLLRLTNEDKASRALLYFDVHHVVADGLTLEILKRDLAAAYEGRLGPPPALGFANYALWENRQGIARQNMLQLAEKLKAAAAAGGRGPGEALPASLLPEQKKRPPQFSSRGGLQTFTVESDLLSRARSRCRELGVTTAAFMLGIWCLAIGRYTGGRQVTMAIGDSGRKASGLENMPGQFSANIPLVLRFSGLTLRQLARQAQQELASASAHAPGALDLLAEALELSGHRSRAAIVDLGFSYMNYSHYRPGRQDSLFLGALDLKPKASCKGDLVIFTTENQDKLEVDLEYYAEAFSGEFMADLGRCFVTLLRAAAGHPDPEVKVDQLDGLPPDTRQLLSQWGRGPGLEPDDKAEMRSRPLTLGLKEQAEAAPERAALTDSRESFTYRQVWSLARRTAAVLLAKGFSGGPVFFLMERSAREKIAQAGVLLAGGICAPLNHRTSPAQIRRQVREAAALISGPHPPIMGDNKQRVDELGGVEFIDLHQLMREAETRGLPAGLPGDEAGGDDPAYILFTSGSTGRPKGILMPHRSLTHLLLRPNPSLPRPGERILQAAAPSFDYAVHEIWAAWHGGAELYVPPEEALLNAAELGRVIKEAEIRHLFLTPSLLKRLLLEDPGSLAGLRVLLAGGERISYGLAQNVLAANPRIEFYNGYGPAETGVFASTHRVTGPDQPGLEKESPPLGRPVWGTRIDVTDELGRLSPPWAWGEIVVGGPCVALGYLNQPELTEAGFAHPDGHSRPLGADGVPRWYRTGDVGRWAPQPEGPALLEFGGRRDQQVKIRGWRVELLAVEELIIAHPQVRAAAVMVEDVPVSDAPGGETEKRLTACLLTRPGFLLDDLRRLLRAELSPQEIPARFLSLNEAARELPVNPNGKLDREALKNILASLPEITAANTFEPPLGRAEQAVAEAYAQVLKVARVGRADNFFELGGHSLLAVRIRNQVAHALDAVLTIGDIFRHPEVRELAAHIEGSGLKPGSGRQSPIPAAPAAANYPSTYAQSRLYLESLLDRSSVAFIINLPLELKTDLNVRALRLAFEALTARHESLRTSFEVIEGEVRQIIQATVETPFYPENFKGTGGRERALERVAALTREPVDPASAPLWRLHLLECSESIILLLRFHHILTDGWGVHEFYRELDLFYQAFAQGGDGPEEMRGGDQARPRRISFDQTGPRRRKAPFGALPAGPQMKDVAVWQRGQAPETEDNLSWWKERLAAAPRQVALPEDYSRPSERGSKGGLLRLELPLERLQVLHQAALNGGGSLSTWLLARYARLLAGLSGQEDMVVGLGIAGRNHLSLERVVGFFMNILPIRIRLAEDMPMDMLTREVHASVLAAFDHQTFPFDRLVREVAPVRDPRYPPLCNVNFEYQNFPAPHWPSFLGGPPDWPEAKRAELARAVDSGTSKADLSLYCLENQAGLTLLAEYNSEVYAAETVQSWLSYYLNLLNESLESQ